MDKSKKPGQPTGAIPAQDGVENESTVSPNNAASGEMHQRFFPEMRRPKPNDEAIAAALEAMQRLTTNLDSETAAEETAAQTTGSASGVCPSCGHHNREGNKFCGMCGLPVDAASNELPARGSPGFDTRAVELPDFARELTQNLLPAAGARPEVHSPSGAAVGSHHYHHHYHHHYFPGGVDGAGAAPRVNAPESAREADRLRVAAAAKGEPMSRSEAAVRRLTQEWVLACNTRQLDELLELYTPDAVVLRSNLPLLRGASAVREFFFSAIESGLGEVALEPIRVEVVGDVAHEVGRYSALVPGTAGKRREERGKYLWVFAKQNTGDWKLVSECWSSDLTLSSAESDIPKAIVPAASKPRKV